MSEYSILVDEPTATLEGTLDAVAQLQVLVGQNWKDVRKASKAIELIAVDVNAILDDPILSDEDKRAAIAQLIRDQVDWSINMADEAINGIGQLFGGWPIRIPL